jgi:hypothetical protein
MNRRIAGIALLALLLSVQVAFAQSAEVTGYVQFDGRMTIVGDEEFSYNENILGLAVNANPADRISMLGSVEFVGIGVDQQLDIEQQQDRTQVDPLQLNLDEAWFQTVGLGLKNLDLKFGKQRIQWGTGDQFNPTDNLNPDDLHDPLNFGEKLPTVAIQANYYAGPVTITAVVLPLFTPTLLPQTDLRPIYEDQFDELATTFTVETGDPVLDTIMNSLMGDAIADAELDSMTVASTLPDKTPENVSAAIKVAATFPAIDFSASYAYVFDDFGVPRRIQMTAVPFDSGTTQILDTVDVEVEQQFPRTQVIGADFTTSIPVVDVGFWGEAGYFIPVPFKTEYFLDTGDTTNRLLTVLSEKAGKEGLVIGTEEPLEDPYIKAVAGMDYTFPGAWYLNLQYVRGLPNDNTAELVEDYFVAGIEKPFLHDSIKLRFFAGHCFGDDSGFLFPEIYFYPLDSLEFELGVYIVAGDVDTKFGASGDDLALLKATVKF